MIGDALSACVVIVSPSCLVIARNGSDEAISAGAGGNRPLLFVIASPDLHRDVAISLALNSDS